MLAVCYKPGRSQDELARVLCLDKSTVARALAHLEKHGYIVRLPNEKDRRQYLVHPTEKMLGTLAELLIPFILTYILDHIIVTMEVSRIVLYGVIMILCSAAACVCNVTANRMAYRR